MKKNEFMKVTKKITAATLIVMTTISLTACGKDSSSNTEASLEADVTQIQTEDEKKYYKKEDRQIPIDDYHVTYVDDRSNSDYKDKDAVEFIINMPNGWQKSVSGLMETKDASGQYTITLHQPTIYQQMSTPEGTGWYEYSKYNPNAGMTILEEDGNDMLNSFLKYIKEKEGDRITNLISTGGWERNYLTTYYYIPKSVGGSYYMVLYYGSRLGIEQGDGVEVWELESDMPDFEEKGKDYLDTVYISIREDSRDGVAIK